MLSSTLAALATLIPSPVRTALEQAHATHGGGEANLILPDLDTGDFLGMPRPHACSWAAWPSACSASSSAS
jgi:hypothetical protein